VSQTIHPFLLNYSLAGFGSLAMADNSAVTVRSDAHSGPQFASGWREGILVVAIVLSPVALATMLSVVGLLAVASWQIAHRAAVVLPSPANFRPYGFLAFAAASWIAVAAAWWWSSRRGLSGEVFRFRRLSSSALVATLAGFLIVLYGVPIVVHGVSQFTGGRGPDVRIDFDDTLSVCAYRVLFVVTTPVTEEILYRGVLVAWLRRGGWRAATILPVGTLLFAANHILPLGVAWGTGMVVLGAVLFALRLRYDSLTPAWLAHGLFNAQPFLVLPLLDRFAPVLHPGRF
jgi:membrane protease YdiL (CAAX protease family)